jgi:hypothetical protein
MAKPKTFAVYRWEDRQSVEVGRYKVGSAPGAVLAHIHAASVTDAFEQRKFFARLAAPPSAEQLHVLDLASRQGTDIGYVPLVDGKGSQSRTVGRGLTIEACQRRGWLDRAGALTDAGRQVLVATEERRNKRLGLA